ncbi:hypothetical protein FOS14_07135 [Skermania sp. ID1734]|uniref:hypothetical protein n=1 Tax=Skermania sp. ID1734 TaxID=2597516 RepID=UPI00117CAAF4|nr:hypothetical protein [Skermania sp. ID1734]TSE00776.1 hypothetical protein FOS14_07135 [Skermania sp. ID1734]
MESFAVDCAEIFGMGTLAQELAVRAEQARGLLPLATHSDGYHGLMWALKPAIDGFAADTQTRLLARQQGLESLGFDLRKAGWRYNTQDRANADSIADQHARIQEGAEARYSVDEMPGAARFPLSEPSDLSPPEVAAADVASVIDETRGVVSGVDAAIRTITGWIRDEPWSPLLMVIEPLSGNWTELERAGEIFAKSGNASEDVAKNLDRGADRVNSTWDGKAALEFLDYAGRLARALEWEGPLGRIAERVLQATSEQIQSVATVILQKINDVVRNRIVKSGLRDVFAKVATTLVPGGWVVTLGVQAYEIGSALVDLHHEIQQLLDQIKKVIEDARAVLDTLHNPADLTPANLVPLREKVRDAADGASLAEDLVRVAGIGAVLRAPTSKYAAPQGSSAWENAS